MIRKAYYNLFHRIAHYRLRANDVDVRSIHTHLLSTILTGLLMWAYAFTAFYTISSPVPGIVGFITSIIHLFSPLLFLVSNNVILITLVMLISGVIHQGTFSYYTGGYESHILIWYGIIPMLAGIIAGLKTLIITSITVFIISGAYFVLHLTGYEFPYLITKEGWIIAQSLLVFGWIIVSTSVVAYFLFLNKKIEDKLNHQKEKSDNLLQVLLHDISNQVQVIGVSSKLLNHVNTDCRFLNMGRENISNGCKNVNSVIHSVRSMYIYEKQNRNIDLKPISLLECINDAIRSIEKMSREKEVSFDLPNQDFIISSEPNLLIQQVFVNLLSNSVKFSKRGKRIKINFQQLHENKVYISISDQGIGIPKEILRNLFNSNTITTRLGTENEKGTGLGMLIAKSICELLDGKLEVHTSTEEDRSGTQYNITLPLA